MNQTVTKDQLIHALRDLGVSDEKMVVVVSDLAAFGGLDHEGGDDRSGLQVYFDALQEVTGAEGTIVVPTFTYVREGRDTPYIHESSVSETGVLTEYIRRLDGSVRSLHPVFSFAAIGARSRQICDNVSGHSYAANTPAHRLLEEDAFVISLGLSPHRGAFFIHVAEVMAGVPYRYSKELSIPVSANGEWIKRPFFHFVKYSNADIEWDTNRLVERMNNRALLNYRAIGASGIWAYRAQDIYDQTIALLTRNIYGLLARPPVDTPWK